ncbi:MAG: hypothetical protein AVDCRST_MAG56-2475, partial [uncultured Cytophagales bacterium]
EQRLPDRGGFLLPAYAGQKDFPLGRPAVFAFLHFLYPQNGRYGL